MRVLFDVHVLDFLSANRTALSTVTDALVDGRLELLQTHILEDELAKVPEPSKLARLQLLRVQLRGQWPRVASSLA